MVYNADHGTLDSPRLADQVRLVKGAGEFLRKLREAGYFTVLATNQPGIAKGTLSPEELSAVQQRLTELLKKDGGELDDVRICTHHPQYGSPCHCRKPLPGLLTDAAREHDIDLAQSWMVGDGLVDVEAGNAAGCKTILLTKLKLYHVERFFDTTHSEPYAVAGSLAEAFDIITGKKGPERKKG